MDYNFLVGKTESQGQMLLDKLGDYKIQAYSKDRIIPLGTFPLGHKADRILVRIKKERIFEVLGKR